MDQPLNIGERINSQCFRTREQELCLGTVVVGLASQIL